MNYNAYDELMHYFQYELNVYLVLAAIVLAGTVRTLLAYFQAKKVGAKTPMNIYTLFVSFLAIFGLANAMLFQGVMSDIPLESGQVWITKATYIFIASMVLFLIQVGCVISIGRTSKQSPKK